jgi:hypothetical protein
LSIKTDQIAWRRSKVVEFRARGMTHEEIAHELQVSRQSITADIAYLREQAKETIKEYATDYLPAQYQVCLVALDSTIKRAFDIFKEAVDNREKLQALDLFKDTHLVKLELLSNATIIDHALEYIRSKQQHRQQEQEETKKIEATTTTNQVF